MFDHSIKVPRLYKSAAKIAKEVSESKGSIKQLVYESKHPVSLRLCHVCFPKFEILEYQRIICFSCPHISTYRQY